MLNPGQFDVGSNPVPEVAAGAQRYRQINGLMAPEQDYSKSLVTPTQTRQVGQAYMNMPEYNSRALPAYHAMREETGRQFDFMTKPRSKGGMGIDVSVSHQDPYGGFGTSPHNIVRDLRNDVEGNNHISVLSTAATGGHPVFSNDENDQFRAVHDVFGHLAAGRAVDRHGEEAAFQKHASMFSPLARQAMATETRGQNAALHLNSGQFQEQKVGILPSNMRQPYNMNVTSQPGEMQSAVKQAREFNRNFGIANTPDE